MSGVIFKNSAVCMVGMVPVKAQVFTREKTHLLKASPTFRPYYITENIKALFEK